MKKKIKLLPSFNFRHMFAAPLIIFLIMLVVLPMILLLWHAFSGNDGFTFEYFVTFAGDRPAQIILLRSIGIAFLSTFICIIIAYPIAYGLTMAGFKRGQTILVLFILPLWINILLRSFALSQLFLLIGLQQGLTQLVAAMVIDLLPFMILPIYIVLSNINKHYIEASQDLGARPHQVFLKTVLPLSIPGILSGFVLVFSATVSAFFQAEMFGNNRTRMFGQIIDDFFEFRNLGPGAVHSLVVLVIVLACMIITNRFSKIGNKKGGLW